MPRLQRIGWLTVNLALLALAFWGFATFVFAGLYWQGWLPARWEKSLHTGGRMARVEWLHTDDQGRHIRTPANATPAPSPVEAPNPSATPPAPRSVWVNGYTRTDGRAVSGYWRGPRGTPTQPALDTPSPNVHDGSLP